MPGTLFVVATPIGNLEDITTRALRVLRQVRLIAAEDTRRTARLLARYAINTPTTSFHQHNESRKLTALVERLQRGEDVALVSDAGTPTISDPGQHLVRAAISAGIRVEPIPGPSALLAALAGSGLGGSTFTFLGFPPTRSQDRRKWFEQLRTAGPIVVFFEAPHRLRATLQHVQDAFGDCQVAVAREVTKVHEEFVRGPISLILEHFLKPIGEFTIVMDLGHQTEQGANLVPATGELLRQFCQMTERERLSRRSAIGKLARAHGMRTNEVYRAIEKARKSVM